MIDRNRQGTEDGFSAEDDEIILEFASFYNGPNKWGVVTIFVKNKSPDQICNRWMKLTEGDFRKNLTKVKFKPYEVNIVRNIIKVHGILSISHIA